MRVSVIFHRRVWCTGGKFANVAKVAPILGARRHKEGSAKEKRRARPSEGKREREREGVTGVRKIYREGGVYRFRSLLFNQLPR